MFALGRGQKACLVLPTCRIFFKLLLNNINRICWNASITCLLSSWKHLYYGSGKGDLGLGNTGGPVECPLNTTCLKVQSIAQQSTAFGGQQFDIRVLLTWICLHMAECVYSSLVAERSFFVMACSIQHCGLRNAFHLP